MSVEQQRQRHLAVSSPLIPGVFISSDEFSGLRVNEENRVFGAALFESSGDGEETFVDESDSTKEAYRYLQSVREEAITIPNVMIARNSPSFPCQSPSTQHAGSAVEKKAPDHKKGGPLPSDCVLGTIAARNTIEEILLVHSIIQPPRGLEPDLQWQRKIAKMFCDLRQKIEHRTRLIDYGDRKKTLSAIQELGLSGNRSFPPSHSFPPLKSHNKNTALSLRKWEEFCFGGEKGHPPTFQLVCYLDHLSAVWILQSISQTMSQRSTSADAFSELKSKWIYALLARLEFPIEAFCSSALYSLACALSNIRSNILDREHPLISHTNILITLLIRVFGMG